MSKQYESASPNVRWIAISAFSLMAVIGLCLVLSGSLRRWFADNRQTVTERPFAIPNPRSDSPPLNPSEGIVRSQYEAEQMRKLSSYGWIDREQQTVRIPIDRAMQIVVERNQGPP